MTENKKSQEELNRDAVTFLQQEVRRLVNSHYYALLECTAWMGIPEKKRMGHIEETHSNAKFIGDQAIQLSKELMSGERTLEEVTDRPENPYFAYLKPKQNKEGES